MGQLEKLREEQQIRKARKNFVDFFEYVFSWKEKEELKIQPFQKDWDDKINSCDRALILSPRDHGKTTQISIARPIYRLGKDPNLRIKVVCQSDDKSQDILASIIAHLDNNERLRKVFPELRPADKGSWTKHKIFVRRDRIMKDASIEAFGIISSGTGGRADIIFFDDVVDYRNAILQPSLRKVVVESFFGVWLNLLEEDGEAVYIATVWHPEDLTHVLLDKPEWSPALIQRIPDDFSPLWPGKWSKERLIKRFNDIGEREFNRGFRNLAYKPEDKIFGDADVDESMIEVLIKKDWRHFSGLDPAIGKKKESSRTVLYTIALDDEDIRNEVDIIRGRYSSPDTARLMMESYEQYKQESIFVENNAYQQAIAEWMLEVPGGNLLPIYSYRTGIQKVDLNMGLPSLALELQKRLWRFKNLDHAPECQCGHCVFIRSLKSWPSVMETDTIMAWWLASRSIRMGMKEPNVRWIK